jgi:hypothetical protein
MRRILFSPGLLLAVLILSCGTLVHTADVAAQVASGSDEPWNPCDESVMGGPGDWAVFNVWRFQTGASADVESVAKNDILRMEAQCPGTHFIKGKAIRRHGGSNAILYKTEPNSKFGPIFVAYFQSDGGIVRELCRAGSEEAGRHAYANFLHNVRGEYGECIIYGKSK